MKENEYRAELRKILDENSEETAKRLNLTLQNLPEKSESIELMIFPGQDGDGSFSVRVSLTGPDLYVLNKAIEDTADIFDVKYSECGLEPGVPMMDVFDSSFEVNDTLSDVVGEWLISIWSQTAIENINLPVMIVADEDYGTKLPIELN